MIFKIHIEPEKTLANQSNPELKKSKTRGTVILDFKMLLIFRKKNNMALAQNRHVDQWSNRRPTHEASRLILDDEA